MQTKVCLVACASSKVKRRVEAQDLYHSALFSKSRSFAIAYAERWFVLSAKHGLLNPTQVISPYDETLGNFTKQAREQWAARIEHELLKQFPARTNFIILAGAAYRDMLAAALRTAGMDVDEPLNGLSIGRQLQWLDRASNENRLADLERFYALLDRLDSDPKQGLRLRELRGNQNEWPTRGVYFFREGGETQRLHNRRQRVVRVGTHAVSLGSSSTLWQRLRTHRGGQDFGGSHRSSIFRLHVGAALLRQSNAQHPTWGIGQNAVPATRKAEAEIEQEVSRYLGAMQVSWLNIPDEASPASDRSYIERNSIALLAGREGPIDIATSAWLGNHSPTKAIVASSLWNIDYVFNPYDRSFLDVFEHYVDITLGVRPAPTTSLAPPNWRQHASQAKDPKQLKLF